MDPVHRQQAAAHRLEPLTFPHQLLVLPTHRTLTFFFLTGHPHHAKGFPVAPDVSVQSLAQGQRADPIRLQAFAPLVPALWLHHEIGYSFVDCSDSR